MRFINLLRQEVRIIPADGEPEIVFPSQGYINANETVISTSVDDENLGRVPVTVVTPQRITGMPDPQEGVSYIVPWKVLQTMRASGSDISDVYCPDTAVREQGRIVGSRSLIRYTS